MPCKFRRYVVKRYSRKSANIKLSVLPQHDSLVDSAVQTDLQFNTDVDMPYLGTETVDIEQDSVAVQTDTDLSETTSVETQTEVIEKQDVELQANELDEMMICIGNSDEKFHPLVAKHKGVFKDVTGLYF